MKLAAAHPSRGAYHAGRIFARLDDEPMHVVGVGLEVAAHDNDMAAPRDVEPVAQCPAQKRQLLIQHHHQLAEVLLDFPNHCHGLVGRALAYHNDEFFDVLLFDVAQNDIQCSVAAKSFR